MPKRKSADQAEVTSIEIWGKPAKVGSFLAIRNPHSLLKPYIGKVINITRTNDDTVFKVQWLYHPDNRKPAESHFMQPKSSS